MANISPTILARGKANYEFTNWANTFSCSPELYFEPSTTEEIREVLKAASELRKKVRVVGMGHSPSDVACTTDFMISLVNYNAILKTDHEKFQVTVQGGLTMTDLNKFLEEQGMALSNMGSISEASCAGLIATGTHGSGAGYGIMATNVVAMKLMTANGDVINCSREENEDVFLCALCSIGAMGVVLSMTWQCEPAFRLHQKLHPFTLNEVLENLDKEVHSSEHFRLLWYPHTDQVQASYVNRTDKPLFDNSSWFWDYVIGYYSLELSYWLSSFIPWMVRPVNRFFVSLLHSKPTERVDVSHKVFNFECLFKQYVTEWAIPREETAFVLRRLRAWMEDAGFSAHLPIEVRFVKGDDICMSPSYGRDTCYINIISYRPYNKLVPHADYWEFFEELMTSVGGRPHWAKAHKFTSKELAQRYPKFKEFKNMCEKLDPEGLFRNEYTDRTIFAPIS